MWHVENTIHQAHPTAAIFLEWLDRLSSLHQISNFKSLIAPNPFPHDEAAVFRQLTPPSCPGADGLHLMHETFDTSPSVNS